MSDSGRFSDRAWLEQPPAAVRLRSWPLVESARRTAAAIGGLTLVAAVVAWAGGRVYLGVLAAGMLALAGWRFFVPVSYELDADGVTQTCLGLRRRIAWRAIGRYEVRESGILLLPFADRTGLDPLRGLFLPWGQQADEVRTIFSHYLGAPAV